MIKNKKIIIFHFLFWMIYILLCFWVVRLLDDDRYFITPFYITFARNFSALIIFYIQAFIFFPICLNRKKDYYLLVLYIPISIILNFIIRFLLFGSIVPFLANTPKPEDTPFAYFVFGLNWWLQFSMYALGYWYAMHFIKNEKLLRQKELENHQTLQQNLQLQIENEKLTNQKMEADYN